MKGVEGIALLYLPGGMLSSALPRKHGQEGSRASTWVSVWRGSRTAGRVSSCRTLTTALFLRTSIRTQGWALIQFRIRRISSSAKFYGNGKAHRGESAKIACGAERGALMNLSRRGVRNPTMRDRGSAKK